MEIISLLVYVVLLILAVQLLRFIFADGDLTLMWKERFGLKPDVLARQVVWITGASMGIGEYFAYEMSKAGCRLVLSARSKELLETVKQKCLAVGRLTEDDILVLPFDILDLSSHQQVTEKVIEKFGQIDVLLNNAGRSQHGSIINTEIGVVRDIIELNIMSQVSLTKCVLPFMVKRQRGQVVINSSLLGKAGMRNTAAYNMTKFAVIGWYQSLAHEVGEHNIKVTVVCPGPVVSNITRSGFTETRGKNVGITGSRSKQMSTERCAQLMAVGVANKLPEIWIAPNPFLFCVYLAQYAPSLLAIVVTHAKVGEIKERKE